MPLETRNTRGQGDTGEQPRPGHRGTASTDRSMARSPRLSLTRALRAAPRPDRLSILQMRKLRRKKGQALAEGRGALGHPARPRLLREAARAGARAPGTRSGPREPPQRSRPGPERVRGRSRSHSPGKRRPRPARPRSGHAGQGSWGAPGSPGHPAAAGSIAPAGPSRAAPPHTGAARARRIPAPAPPRPPGIRIRPGRGGAALLKGPSLVRALASEPGPDTLRTFDSEPRSSPEGFGPLQKSSLGDSGLRGSDRGRELQSHLRLGWISAGQITGCSSSRMARDSSLGGQGR